MMDGKLSPLKHCVQVKEMERQVIVTKSREHGMQTKYLKTVCRMEMTSSFKTQVCRIRSEPVESSSPGRYADGTGSVMRKNGARRNGRSSTLFASDITNTA